jgi:hypothetical protein
MRGMRPRMAGRDGPRCAGSKTGAVPGPAVVSSVPAPTGGPRYVAANPREPFQLGGQRPRLAAVQATAPVVVRHRTYGSVRHGRQGRLVTATKQIRQ